MMTMMDRTMMKMESTITASAWGHHHGRRTRNTRRPHMDSSRAGSRVAGVDAGQDCGQQ